MQLCSDAIASQSGITHRCSSSNFRWEQAVSVGRAADYTEYVGDVTTKESWRAEHKGYLHTSVHIARDIPRSSECFTSINTDAHLNSIVDDTYLLRLESIAHLFERPLIADMVNNFWQRFFNSQKDLKKQNISESDQFLRGEFLNQWNALRTQSRPMFATFLNSFGGDLKNFIKSDWAHTLRDSLGLTHLVGSISEPLPVILTCYTVKEVNEARTSFAKNDATASFSRPTVLDMDMSSAFIPAPLQFDNQSYGYTLDLAKDEVPEDFIPEILNYPIDYSLDHIKALGFISRDHNLNEDKLILTARNRHITGLRRTSKYEKFGEILI